ncbi:DUF2520 domain-containing protein [Sphingobium amiense]|uniref:DUF2520 domain-containing protein n=1 Tax=Sphingobium amiense TaxID=135719 RepID=A0A494WCD0_9SPHN|nr:DUF2520 domain-containing protein [Sphingobium amiense]BBD98450.1 DUF2520 domain-containing protein [Sphingobium amiense]
MSDFGADFWTGRRIGVVGTGRVARAVALALRDPASAPVKIWGRDPARRDAAAAMTGGQGAESPAVLCAQCDIVALAVADDALETVVADLTGAVRPGTFIFHVSGRSGAAVLDPLAYRGALTAAIHPAMTFTGDTSTEVARMAGACFAVTAANDEAMALAQALVRRLGGVPVAVAEAHRTLYHAALSHAANHLVTLIAGARAALEAAGVEEPGALLAPLTRAALDNSLDRGMAALSGPLLRGDAGTVADHLAALERDCPEMLPAYRAMARATIDALERRGGPVSPAIAALLDTPDRGGASGVEG